MHVHDISEASFAKFADDLLQRLDNDRPLVWVPVGNSGARVVLAILERAKLSSREWHQQVAIARLGWDPDTRTHRFESASDVKLVEDAKVLLVDSVVNSGTTMLSAIEACSAAAKHPRSVTIYAVAVRQSSAVIPNIFALSIGANDRVFLHWQDHRPNNRLTPSGVYRSLQESDLVRPPFNCERDFINRVPWRDRWFELRTNPQRRVIVCEAGGEIISFVTFTLHVEHQDLHIDEIATAIGHAGGGNAGALLRYAETVARASGCTQMSLWSHETVIERYRHWGFSLSEKVITCGSDGCYRLMSKGLGSSKDELARWHGAMKTMRGSSNAADGARRSTDSRADASDGAAQALLASVEMPAAIQVVDSEGHGAATVGEKMRHNAH